MIKFAVSPESTLEALSEENFLDSPTSPHLPQPCVILSARMPGIKETGQSWPKSISWERNISLSLYRMENWEGFPFSI